MGKELIITKYLNNKKHHLYYTLGRIFEVK
jgi:hypothetical protein